MTIFFFGINTAHIARIAAEMGATVSKQLTKEIDLAICYNWKTGSIGLLRKLQRRKVFAVLVKSEPTVVIPEHSRARLNRKFNLVIELGRDPGTGSLPFPQSFDTTHFQNSSRIESCVALSANKLSFISGEHYSFRAKCYSALQRLDVFGPGWDNSRSETFVQLLKELLRTVILRPTALHLAPFRSAFLKPRVYRGIAQDKLEVLSKYKATLVVENSSEYMSEKLLDALMAGTIPVYVGPSPGSYGIPEGLVKTCNATLGDVRMAIEDVLSWDREKWAVQLESWLKELIELREWQGDAVMGRIVKIGMNAAFARSATTGDSDGAK